MSETFSHEEELLLRAHEDQDEESRAELLDRLRPFIHTIVSGKVPPSELDDIVSLTIEGAWRNFNTLREPSLAKFKVWLRSIASNSVNDYYRRRYRKPGEGTESASLDEYAAKETVSQRSSLDESLEIEEALESLGEIDASILLLSSVYGYSAKEIREIMAQAGTMVTESAIYSRIYRAKRRLKALLDV